MEKNLKNIENVEFKPSSLSDSTNKYSIRMIYFLMLIILILAMTLIQRYRIHRTNLLDIT